MRSKRNAARWVAIVACGICSTSIDAADSVESIRGSASYKEAFRDYYARLNNLPVDLLVDLLGDQIDTALVRQGHIAAGSLEHRVQRIEQDILQSVKSAVCDTDANSWSVAVIEMSAIEGALPGLSDEDALPGDFARISAAVARIVQSQNAAICRLDDFRQL